MTLKKVDDKTAYKNLLVKYAELESNFRICEKNADTYYDLLTKVKEILQTILDKWKEERWILQSEEEVKQIENLMKQAEQFIKEIKENE